MSKEVAKEQFSKLIERYMEFRKTNKKINISEETIRTWLNEMLLIFGWNVQNTNEVQQEKKLLKKYRNRLKEINSTHTKPDYILVNGTLIKSFLDAKDLKVSIADDKEVAFQIRSYGWSSEIPCAFVSNFEEFGIYDCRFVPNPKQNADFGMQYFRIEDYINNFDIIYDHLYKDNILRGKHEELYSTTLTEGKNKLDEKFTDMLSQFRVELAINILKNNKTFIGDDNIRLNYFVQVIMDRIIFIRVCESRGIEEVTKLKNFLSSGFWVNFTESCYMDFFEHYDGAMFNKDNYFQELKLDNSIFENFINNLYYPSPYKFDVIPVKVIANIYENFLSRQLEITGNTIIETFKAEYIKTQGAISTPKHIVESICRATINFDNLDTMNKLLDTKILDPTCGSGIFLVTCFELLENKMISLFKESKIQKEYSNWFVDVDENIYLTVDAKREIMKLCLHGIDCDESAIEVTKMSLALKIIDNNDLIVLDKVGVFGERILREVHINIRLGNTLINTDISLDKHEFNTINPFDIVNTGFKDVFEKNGGFDYIIGNPPYVETKHFKSASPKMHTYLSDKYTTFAGKADLAILFIERCVNLLNDTGILGFIVQKRFFKTDYGVEIRRLISTNRYLSKMIDFKTEKLFLGRITYVAIMVLDKRGSDFLDYEYIDKEPLYIKFLLENDEAYKSNAEIKRINISSDYITEKNWSFESYQFLSILTRLRKQFGTFGAYPNILIKDGVQALWKKAYHLTDYTIKDDILTGKNGWGETVRIELAMAKGIIYNKSFYCYKELSPDAYSLFPYEGIDLRTPIKMSKVKKEYPLTYEYLQLKEDLIKAKVEHFDDPETWHIFTREHNHDTYNDNKIILPMTAFDTISTFVESKGLFMDNSNVWFIKINGANSSTMMAISSIINSTAFSVFATAEANPQSGGYYKLNKQFLMPVPFPSKNLLLNQNAVDRLAKLYDIIKKCQEEFKNATPNRKELVGALLESHWNELDEIVYGLYELKGEELELVKNKGRNVNRISILE